MYRFAVVIPTLNGGHTFERLLASVDDQILKPNRKIVIDSGSDDDTVNIAKKYNWEIVLISKEEYNHGATRQMGVKLVTDCDIVVYLTQDAILTNSETLTSIISNFKQSDIGAAYGRQLPHLNARPFGAHARLFNYSDKSMVKSIDNAAQFGIKAAFISNSFAAYRINALLSVGGFPSNTILSEDTYVAAKMLLAGWKIYYNAEAQVYHSHDYTLLQEFRRYFDIGVFHSRESWIREKFGKAEGEGMRFVLSEINYLWKSGNSLLIPEACIRTFIKLLGYRLGLKENIIPHRFKCLFSMHKKYWIRKNMA
ncbi:glycosyltransferase family 2 protein [Desulfoscipio geothermicus]|uniref:Rhamnosyltransferase n=1 Tax=Desulfoscipio geothermicus DSM 3669 TaxID=1121426 RepID=A0A1I6E936_9FIRM|nr:glycosyltransferase family 2 protein [Desulfoscipio geothermicus]SFR14255.1 rhamnosyltransferase [Desulfoscipio geothermicus DSM 3669]